MSSDDASTCSCSSSHDSGSSADCLHDESSELNNSYEHNVDWIRESTDGYGNMFYLRNISSDCSSSISDAKNSLSHKKSSGGSNRDSFSPFTKMQKLRSSYSKVASFFKKRPGSGRKLSLGSFKRKSSRKNRLGAAHKEDTSQATNSPEPPQISVSSGDELLGSSLINEDISEEHEKQLRDIIGNNFSLLFLTPPTENSSNDRDCLVYSYPKSVEGHENLMCKLKGMFVTLNQLVNDVTNQLPLTTRIGVQSVEHVEYESGEEESVSEIFVVGYVHEFNGVLAIAVPEAIHHKVTTVSDFIKTVTDAVRFRFDSLANGFMNTANHVAITQLLNVLCYNVFSDNDQGAPHYLYPNVIQKAIIDDEDLVLNISDVMSEYEAMDWLADFDLSSPELASFGSSTDFIVIGSTLFFKNILVASHLASGYSADLLNYMNMRGFLKLSQSHSIKSISWLEVYPTRLVPSESLTKDFNENQAARYFLLVVIINSTVFAVLLEMPFLSVAAKTKPDTHIIIQTLKFVVANFNNSGLMDEVAHHVALQQHFYTSRALALLEGDKRNKNPSPGKSHSLRDLFHLSPSSHTSPDNLLKDLSSRSMHSLLGPSSALALSSPKPSSSSSTPSLLAGTLPSRASPDASSSCSASELCQSQRSFSNGTGSTALQSDSFASFSTMHLENLRNRLPGNLLLFLDVNLKTGTFLGPFINVNLSRRLVNDIIPKFREACIYLKSQLDGAFSTVSASECGMHFTIKNHPSHSVVSYKRKPKKPTQDQFVEGDFWVCCRKQTSSRELFACFCVAKKEKNMAFNFCMDSLGYALDLQDKER